MCIYRCTLRELYEAIMTAFPYYRRLDIRRSWQNSIRHCLSFNDCFVKVPASETARRCYWTLHPDANGMFDSGCFLRRSHRFRSNKPRDHKSARKTVTSSDDVIDKSQQLVTSSSDFNHPFSISTLMKNVNNR